MVGHSSLQVFQCIALARVYGIVQDSEHVVIMRFWHALYLLVMVPRQRVPETTAVGAGLLRMSARTSIVLPQPCADAHSLPKLSHGVATALPAIQNLDAVSLSVVSQNPLAVARILHVANKTSTAQASLSQSHTALTSAETISEAGKPELNLLLQRELWLRDNPAHHLLCKKTASGRLWNAHGNPPMHRAVAEALPARCLDRSPASPILTSITLSLKFQKIDKRY